MKTSLVIGLGLVFTVFGCKPPAKPQTPGAASSSPAPIASSNPEVAPSAEVVPAQPLPSAAAPVISPCPPEVSPPAEGLAWVSDCRILMREKIIFEIEKYQIKPESFPLLEAVGDILLRNPDLHVEIEGHLANQQRETWGMRLSQRRAESVRNYLISKKGVAPSQLTAKGYENSKPLVDNSTESGRQKNRRIELVIVSWGGQIR